VTGGEEGMISLVSLFAVLGLLILFGALANVGRVTARKLETQNAADAVAHGAAVEMARGMNAITTANHLIGELTALCVVHHGFGGDELDDGRNAEHLPSKIALFWGWKDSWLGYLTPVQPSTDAFTSAFSTLTAGGAIRDSRIQLRYLLAAAFELHGAGAALYFTIFFSGWGMAIMEAAYLLEQKILLEWKILDGLEEMAKATKWIKKQIMALGIPALQKYTQLVVIATPAQMELAADRIGTRNTATGRLFPGYLMNASDPLLRLPVEQETARPRSWQKSQLVRATTPWVQYWRRPWLIFGQVALTLSGFTGHYEKRTNEYTRTLTDRLRKNSDIRLYVLPGWEPGGSEKGREEWTRGTDRASTMADQMFSTIGFAHRDPPKVLSYGIYRQTNPDGMVGYAQSMIYGANPQVPSPGAGLQPRLGWDTLHWASAVHEFPGKSTSWLGFSIPSVDEPRVKINWQAKLVPTTRLTESLPYQKGKIGTVIRRTTPLPMNLTGTH